MRVDRGELADATLEWEAVLQLAPDHVRRPEGPGYVLYKQHRLEEAEHHLGLRGRAGRPGGGHGAAYGAPDGEVHHRLGERRVA